MSEAYTAVNVEMVEQQQRAPAPKEEEIPILFLHDVERHYRQGDETVNVLNGIELALWGGQSVALVAPSGAGKSTLLHIAGLLEHPDHGDVYIEGRSTAILPDHERTRIRRNEVGFVTGGLVAAVMMTIFLLLRMRRGGWTTSGTAARRSGRPAGPRAARTARSC